MPTNVSNSRVSRYIKRFREPVLSTDDVYRLVNVTKQHLSKTKLSSRDHVWSSRERHSSNTICPRCGSSLVLRTAKQGANAGKQFLGCTGYPRCLFSKEV